MKKVIIALTITSALFAGTMLSSCESSNSKVDDNKQKTEMADEWKTFRADALAAIAQNETRIAEARVRMTETGAVIDAVLENRIDRLQERNRNLKLKLEAYQYDQSGWESFKEEFNHDMKELGNAFKDITVDNK